MSPQRILPGRISPDCNSPDRISPTVRFQLLLIVALMGLGACTGPEGEDDTPSLGALLARGAAHAEIDQWADARELFLRAAELGPNEPVVSYDLAVAAFRVGDREAAIGYLERAAEAAPAELSARIALLRGKIAYEDGDADTELSSYREAARLAPKDAAYAHALAHVHLRRGEDDEYAALLDQAHGLWTENAFLATELALWTLARPDEPSRRRGLALLEALIEPDSRAGSFLENGRAELETVDHAGGAQTQTGVPRSLRIAVNLLRATKRFQSDATELQSRFEPIPLSAPVLGPPPFVAAPPEIRFQDAPRLSELPLENGEQVLDMVLVDDSLEERPDADREAALALLSDRGLYLLPRRADAFSRLADTTGSRQLLAGDIDDDERMEILVLGAGGVRLWGQDAPASTGGTRWREQNLDTELARAAELRRGLLVDFEHDGDLDLLAVDGDGQVHLITHQGEAGLGPPTAADLPIDAKVRAMAAADLDADADQDLLFATATELLILRNWRQGEYALHARTPLPRGEAVAKLLPVDYDADGQMDVVALTGRGLAFWRGEGQARLTPDAEAAKATFLFSDTVRPRHLSTADLDLDGDHDLLVAGVGTPSRGSGIVALLNDGRGRFNPRADLVDASWPAARGVLALDLDGDRDPDLVSWADAGLVRAFQNQGAESQGWLALRLRAPGRKVPRDGRGVRLQVVAGGLVQWLELDRPNITLGLGRERPELIKATWPNGISEYLFEPEAEIEHTLVLSLRVEGSCPFLYASDGDELRFVTDILGLAPVGMVAAAGGAAAAPYILSDPEEYLRLPDWVAPRDDDILELAITEELREALYLDQVELVTVDTPGEITAWNGEQWLPAPIDGLALRLLSPLQAPASVIDDRGRDVLDRVLRRDERYLRNHRGPNRYQGAVMPHRLTVELPPEVARAERPALVLTGWLHWGNTSTNVARSQDPDGAPMFPILEVPDGPDSWRKVGIAGLPAGKTKPVVLDLTDLINTNDPRVRLTTDFEVYWDRIAAGALAAPEDTPHRVHRLAASSADLQWGGFSRWFRPTADGPYLFDYRDRRSYPWRLDPKGQELVLSWQELEGYYTAYGPVADLLKQADDRMAVVASGEEIKISFDVTSLPPLPDDWRRTYFLHSEGWEKDGDPNVSCSRTVEPLPWRGMSHDPCSGLTVEPGPPGAIRSRWVDRDRLARRVATKEKNP